jgi:hypothetical protein
MSIDLIPETYGSPSGKEAERSRSAWAEAMFLHMRELRYGISPCKNCGKELLLDAQWQVMEWRLNRD